jgi:hypothetical protein
MNKAKGRATMCFGVAETVFREDVCEQNHQVLSNNKERMGDLQRELPEINEVCARWLVHRG